MIDRVFKWVAKRIHGGKKGKDEVCREWHAFVFGFAEVVCPWPPLYRHLSEIAAYEIATERQYYLAGRVVGMVTLPWVLAMAVIAIRRGLAA